MEKVGSDLEAAASVPVPGESASPPRSLLQALAGPFSVSAVPVATDDAPTSAQDAVPTTRKEIPPTSSSHVAVPGHSSRVSGKAVLDELRGHVVGLRTAELARRRGTNARTLQPILCRLEANGVIYLTSDDCYAVT